MIEGIGILRVNTIIPNDVEYAYFALCNIITSAKCNAMQYLLY